MEANQQPDPAMSFNIGVSQPAAQKQKAKTAEEIAEMRKQQTFAQNLGESTKRGREDYAVKLRKERREHDFKEKRMQTSSAQNMSGQQQNQAEQPTDGIKLIDISIDEALSYIGKVDNNEFMREVQKMKFKAADFLRLKELLDSEENLQKFVGACGIRRLLTMEENSPLQKVIDNNIVPKLIANLARDDFPQLQFESAWCITNIACGEHKYAQNLLDRGAIEALIKLMSSKNLEVIEQASWALGNLAGDNTNIRNIIIARGAIDPISQIVMQTPPGTSFCRNVSWCLSNLCRGRPVPQFYLIQKAVVALSKVLIENSSKEIVSDVCWAFSYVTDEGKEGFKTLIENKAVDRLIQLMEFPDLSVSVPCLRTIGNILTGSEEETQACIEAGVLQTMAKLIEHPKKPVRKEVVWSISNITAGSSKQIELCIQSGLFDKLVYLMIHDDPAIKKEAIWAISNATAGCDDKVMEELVRRGIIKALGVGLKFDDPRSIFVTLEGLAKVLEQGKKQNAEMNPYGLIAEQNGLLESLEELQLHNNEMVFKKSQDILIEYFEPEEDGEMQLQQFAI